MVALKIKTGDFFVVTVKMKGSDFCGDSAMKSGEFCGDIDWPLEGDGEQVGHFGQVLGHRCWKTLPCNNKGQCFWITFSISMYIMCVCLFSALSRRVGALQISIIIINVWFNAGKQLLTQNLTAVSK